MANRESIDAPRRPRRLGWIVPVILIALIVIFGLNAITRGIGEAAGVREAAPGDTNASKLPDADGDKMH